jgi:NAD(P)-dependent dehydrogenase (short-subunit alcohol dehydrogenase family)
MLGEQTDFSGKAILVTGAALGLGREAARILAHRGADLCLVDKDGPGLAAIEQELKTNERRVTSVAANLRTQKACANAVEQAVAAFGRLDGLLNVAGVCTILNIAEIDEEIWKDTLETNLSAPFFLSQAALPHLVKSSGAIVNIASASAFKGEAYLSHYAATKAALVSLTRSMAMETTRLPVRINAIAPGGMKTSMAANMVRSKVVDKELLMRAMPLRGSIETVDVAELACFLVSDAARGYHGACVALDGGLGAD